MKRIISAGLAASLMLTAFPLHVSAADQPVKADLEDAVYQQFLRHEQYNSDADGVVTEEELQQIDTISLDLKDVTSLDFLSRMPALKALWLSNGSIDDLSALKQCKGLVTLGLQNMPNVTDISFVKDLNLMNFYLHLDQITDEQKLEVMRYQDAEIEADYSALIGGLPAAMLSAQDVSLKIADPEIACSELQSGNPDESPYSAAAIYGLKEGETTYSVYYKDEVIHTGTIKVKARQQSDPPLKSDITEPELFPSSYYAQDQPLLLKNGSLCKPEDGGLTVLEEDVITVTSTGLFDEENNYYGVDITLHRDGSVFVNGKAPENAKDIRFKRIKSNFCISEDGKLYCLRIAKDKVFLYYVCDGIAELSDDSWTYAISGDGEVILISIQTVKNTDGTSDVQYTAYPTGIMNVICSKNNYYVDADHVLWYADTRSSDEPKISKKATNVEFVGYRHYNKKTYGCVYIKTDGTAYQVENGAPVTLDYETEEPLDVIYFANDNVFYINGKGSAWAYEAVLPTTNYHITEDNVLTMQYEGKYAAITNVSRYLAATGDTMTGDIYAYFIRTDHTTWSYSFRTGEFRCIDDAAEPDPPKPSYDINGDGSFDKKDVTLLQSWLLCESDAVLNNPAAADSDGNKILNAVDLTLMKQALLAGTET